MLTFDGQYICEVTKLIVCVCVCVCVCVLLYDSAGRFLCVFSRHAVSGWHVPVRAPAAHPRPPTPLTRTPTTATPRRRSLPVATTRRPAGTSAAGRAARAVAAHSAAAAATAAPAGRPEHARGDSHSCVHGSWCDVYPWRSGVLHVP